MADGGDPGVRDSDPLVGTQLGGYAIEGPLGKGGMGAVYRAMQLSLNRPVALKVMAARFLGDDASAARFWREARAAAAVNHPNLVQVYDFGESGGTYFYAMELVDGLSLGAYLRRGSRFTERECIEVGREVMLALRAAHAAGVIHRDLKPDNLMLAADGTVKVADLGIARFRQIEGEDSLTMTGVGMGTPAFMSPEQIRGDKEINARSDFYSLGATLFELATCRRPFPGQTVGEILSKQLTEPVPLARDVNPALSEAFSKLIARLMAKEAALRPQTHEEILAALECCLRAATGESEGTTRIRMTDAPNVSWVGSMRGTWPYWAASAAVLSLAGFLLARKPAQPGPWTRPSTQTAEDVVKTGNAKEARVPDSDSGRAPQRMDPAQLVDKHTQQAADLMGRTDAQSAEAELKRGLVLSFTFDGSDPSQKVNDSSGQGNDGLMVGAQWTPGGKHGGGCEFGPVSNSIRVLNKKSLNPQQVTMAAWIKTAHKDQYWRRIFDKGWDTGYTMGISGSDSRSGDAGQGNAYAMICKKYCASERPVADGQWHHVATTFDGYEQRIYVDGQLSCKPIRWRGGITTNNYNLTIGLDGSTPDAYTDNGTASFTGTMDDVMLYNRSLSEKEVLLLFETQK